MKGWHEHGAAVILSLESWCKILSLYRNAYVEEMQDRCMESLVGPKILH